MVGEYSPSRGKEEVLCFPMKLKYCEKSASSNI